MPWVCTSACVSTALSSHGRPPKLCTPSGCIAMKRHGRENTSQQDQYPMSRMWLFYSCPAYCSLLCSCPSIHTRALAAWLNWCMHAYVVNDDQGPWQDLCNDTCCISEHRQQSFQFVVVSSHKSAFVLVYLMIWFLTYRRTYPAYTAVEYDTGQP